MRAHTRGRLVRWLRRDDGVSAVEYAILVGLIVVAVVAGTILGTGLALLAADAVLRALRLGVRW